MMSTARDHRLAVAAARVERALKLSEPAGRPALVLLGGLPGSGKSHFGAELAKRIGAAVVQSDFVRQTLFPAPRYTGPESYWVFTVAHRVVTDLLGRGYRVVFDATNLREEYRAPLYRVAAHAGAALIVVWTTAPEEVVRERLGMRGAGELPKHFSEAGWNVYDRMRSQVEPIRLPHIVVDTSLEIRPGIEMVAILVKQGWSALPALARDPEDAYPGRGSVSS